MEKISLKEKLMNIQSELKAPKGQYNGFGKYKYRSCEDILEAVKPLLNKYKTTLRLNDELVLIGARYYVRATAILTDVESDEEIVNTSFAREEEGKKGMDGSQVTGASSSYARKYALNGLFAIDDVEDPDTTNTGDSEVPKKEYHSTKPASDKQIETIKKTIGRLNNKDEVMSSLLKQYNVIKLEDLTMSQASEAIKILFQ